MGAFSRPRTSRLPNNEQPNPFQSSLIEDCDPTLTQKAKMTSFLFHFSFIPPFSFLFIFFKLAPRSTPSENSPIEAYRTNDRAERSFHLTAGKGTRADGRPDSRTTKTEKLVKKTHTKDSQRRETNTPNPTQKLQSSAPAVFRYYPRGFHRQNKQEGNARSTDITSFHSPHNTSVV